MLFLVSTAINLENCHKYLNRPAPVWGNRSSWNVLVVTVNMEMARVCLEEGGSSLVLQVVRCILERDRQGVR